MQPIREFIVEILLIGVLLVLAVGTLNPFWMPMGLQLVLLLTLVVLFGSFAVFVWRERGGDEREIALRQMSDRAGFLVCSSILLIGIVVEGVIYHTSNPWLLAALIATILAKVVSTIYYRRTH